MTAKERVEQHFEEILYNIAFEGETLRGQLKEKGINPRDFHKYLDEDSTNERKKQYTRACEERADALFMKLSELINDPEYGVVVDEYGNRRIDNGSVNKRKLEIDTLKWQISKLAPKKYGDKLELDNKHDLSDELKSLLQPFTAKKE